MKPTYLKLFNLEIMIEPTTYSAFTYLKESATERELQIGKVKVIISNVASCSSVKVALERF
jgi:precorrin-2 methylase